MKTQSNIHSRKRRTPANAKHRQGAMLVLVVVMIVAFLVTVAFFVDIAYMNLVKSELRTATDAAAKAASEALARTQDRNVAVSRGKAIGLQNNVANRPMQFADGDFLFGRSELSAANGKFVFSSGGTPFNSVRVSGRRTSSSISGSVGLFFGQMFGVNDFEPSEICTATHIQRDIVLVVDRSGSMLDDNKFNDLRSAIAVFVNVMNDSPVNERIGLASYSDFESEDVQLTEDLSLITSRMDSMPVGGFTNISGGIDAGANILSRGRSRDFVERTVVVMTDGLQNRGRPAALAARALAADGATIHAITFGRDADKGAMSQVAAIGKGRFFHAEDGQQLRAIFLEIALTLKSIITE
jgi:Ca-activated chloride channel family protein